MFIKLNLAYFAFKVHRNLRITSFGCIFGKKELNMTVFEMIIKGDIPSTKLYEDGKCIVIMDINPVIKGHSLVICKQPLALTSDVPDEVLSHLICVAKKVDAKLREVLNCDATTIMINNGPAAGQTVPQLHVHVIPRYKDDKINFEGYHEKYEGSEMAILGEKLKI